MKEGILSFNGKKIITPGGDGGTPLTNYKKAMDMAIYLIPRTKDKFINYKHSKTGYTCRFLNLSEEIGVTQLEVVEERVKEIRDLFNLNKNFFKENKSFDFLDEQKNLFCSRRLTTILINPEKKRIFKEKIRLHFTSLGIENSPILKNLRLQPISINFQYFGKRLNKNLFRQKIYLPSGSEWT